MKIRLQDRAAILLKNYWQIAVLALLGMAIMGQAASASWRALELRQIDRMIVQAETIQPENVSETGSSPEASSTSEAATGNRPTTGDTSGRARGGGQDASREPAKNIFRREETNYQLTGVYMNKAVINNREVTVGDRVGQAEVVEITPISVVIREDGSDRTQTLAMFSSGGDGTRGGAAGRRPTGGVTGGGRPGAATGGGGAAGGRQGAPDQAQRWQGGGAAAGGFGGFGGVGGFEPGMSREDMRARFESMSTEEREQFRAEVQQRMGGAGGPGGFGGGPGGRGGGFGGGQGGRGGG